MLCLELPAQGADGQDALGRGRVVRAPLLDLEHGVRGDDLAPRADAGLAGRPHARRVEPDQVAGAVRRVRRDQGQVERTRGVGVDVLALRDAPEGQSVHAYSSGAFHLTLVAPDVL